MEWSDDVVLAFINDVENNPVLWDAKNPYFKLSSKKHDVWLALAEKYQTTWGEMKKKWQSLQASYRREKSKVATKCTETGETPKSTWFAYSTMAFFGDRYNPRKTLNSSQSFFSQQDGEVEGELQELKTEDLISSLTAPEQQPENNSRKPFLSMKRPLAKRKVLKDTPAEDANTFKVFKGAVEAEEKERDEYVIFGEYVAKKLQKLDDHTRAVAQHSINGILFEAEMGQFKQPQ